MQREVGHSSTLRIVRNVRDNMEFLELLGCGVHQSFPAERRGGRGQVGKGGDDLVSFREPGTRAQGRKGNRILRTGVYKVNRQDKTATQATELALEASIEAPHTRHTNLAAYPEYRPVGGC